MRRIGTLKDPHQGVAFGRLLKANGINNQIDVVRVDDALDSSKQSYHCTVWIYDEDQMEKAEFLLDQYVQEEHNPLTEDSLTIEEEKKAMRPEKSPISLFFIALCSILYLLMEATSPEISLSSSNPLIQIPLSAPPIKRELLYDWPKLFEKSDALIEKYGVESLNHPEKLPEAAKLEYLKLNRSPIWFGIYPYLIHQNIPFDANTLFYSIRQGEIWRLFTPALLHYDMFHIFFNMIWLFYLGKMLEKNLRPSNYVALILMAGVVTNTAQYLMTGPNFLGYSGILTAYMGFIWMRQKIAPWEGYPLQKSVIQFMGVFIFGMFGISLVSFLTERFFSFSLAPGIANTAHITGIFVGIFLASLPLFKAKTLRL